MYRYTIQPHVRAEYAVAQRKGWSDTHNCSHVFMLARRYMQQMNISTHTAVFVLEQCLSVTYYSKTRIRNVPVCGASIPVEFFEEVKTS